VVDRTPLETIIADALRELRLVQEQDLALVDDRAGFARVIAEGVREWLRLPLTDEQIASVKRRIKEANGLALPATGFTARAAWAAVVAVLTGDADERP